MSETHWISDWLDDNSFESAEDVTRSLRSPSVVSDLRKLARKAKRTRDRQDAEFQAATSQYSLMAGCGIDLSARLACAHEECRKKQVDELFGRVWHYFDRIIVTDDVTSELGDEWDKTTKENFISHTKTLFHLRQIGAEDLVEFTAKPRRMCKVHLEENIKNVGLLDLDRHLEDLVLRFLPDARIQIYQDRSGLPKFRVAHPMFEIIHSGTLHEEIQAEIEGTLEIKALTFVVRRLIAHLSFDIAASRQQGASLGLVLKTHEMFLREMRRTQVTDVVLNLQLPVLNGLTTWDLIAIRRDEGEYFSRFRDSLTQVIKEKLKLDPNADSNKLALELREDLIEPRLRDINGRLSAAQKLLTKKSGVGLFLGALSTTCGIISGFDPHVAAMGGAAFGITWTGTAAAKYLDEERDIQMDDMYFLWKASQCAPR